MTKPQEIPDHTGSKGTRVLGSLALLFAGLTLLFGLVISPPDIVQEESVRLFYVHVPSAIVSLYIAFGITALGSAIYLYNGSKYWDLMAGAAAEIGVVFLTFTLVTGMLWGRPTWGTYWDWDPRVTSTAVSLILYLGYLAVRRLELDPDVRSRRAAVLGIVSFLNLFIVKFSVEWWRSLHQTSTISPTDTKMAGTMLTSFFLGLVGMLLIFSWMLIHRFRIAWLEEQLEATRLDQALLERRAENPGAVGGPAISAEGA